MIVGTAINNLLLIPAGGVNPNCSTGEAALPLSEGQLAAFSMLFQNAKSGLIAENSTEHTNIESETVFLSEDSGEEQSNMGLLGYAAANFLMGSRTEIPLPAAKTEETATLPLGGTDSEAGVNPVVNTVYLPFNAESAERAERVEASDSAIFLEPEQAQSSRTTGAVAFETAYIDSETKAGQTSSQTGRAHAQFTVQYEGKAFETSDRPAPESVFQPFVPAKNTHESRNTFTFQPLGAKNATDSVQPAQTQDYAFQSDLKAFRAELDAKVGFRMSNAIVQNTAESVTGANPLPEETVWTAAKEQVQTAMKTKARENLAPEVQFTVSADSDKQVNTANVFEESNADTPLKLNNSTDNLKDKSVPAESQKFELRSNEKVDIGTEKVHDLGAAVQREALVHSSSAIQTKDALEKPVDSVVTQLEAPIKKEAAKGNDTSFKIKLKPEGLGEVTVDLKHVSGKLEVSIKTELSSTKELISENIQTLRNALVNNDGPKAFSLVSLTVEQDAGQFSAFSQSGFTGDRHSQPGPGNAFGFQASTEKNNVNSTVRYRTGLIDYTV